MWFIVILLVSVNCFITAVPFDNSKNLASINKFTLTLLDNAYSIQENFGKNNFAISPLSVWCVLSLLTEGSSGDTFQELVTSLNLPSDIRSTQLLHSSVKNSLNASNEDVVIKEQAALYADCSLKINPEFCQSAATYDTDIFLVDTKDSTKLADDINYYICIATDGKIKNVVKPENLENLIVALVEALYFKANWTYTFDPTETHEQYFYNSQGKIIGTVNMMYHQASHHLIDATKIGAQILEMTYGKSKQYSMLILLPFDGIPVKKLLNNLASQPLSWLTELKKPENEINNLEVHVPRFKISSQIDLIAPLKYSGIHSIFDHDRAELPGIADVPLFISKALQNVDIEVDEEGTVAVASTVVGLETRFGTPSFDANKEFVFMLIDKESDIILFTGVYESPKLI